MLESAMAASTPFFHGLRRSLFGRPPVSAAGVLRRATARADALCLRQLSTLLGGLLPDELLRFKSARGANSRQRFFTPVVTFWAFLGQVLDADGCCVRAVSRVQALFASRQMAAPDEDTSAYCRARMRLPIKLLLKAARFMVHKVCASADASAQQQGRLLVMDGTAITLQDTVANREAYADAPGQKPGCGFPLMKLVALFDLRTGAWLASVKCGQRRHDAALAWRLLKHLRAGDILIADRGFCSYAFIAVLQGRGVAVIMRQHQKRTTDMSRGRRLGAGDRLQSWTKAKQCPQALHTGRHAALPEQLAIRLIEVNVAQRGHRTTKVYLATTLLDAHVWSATQIAALYLRRWEVELFFADIKTSQHMDMLRCKSPHMIARELLMHMIAYNVVRYLMTQAEPMRPLEATGMLSFKGTRDRFHQWHWTLWSASSNREAARHCALLLHSIAHAPAPPRPGRSEPRCIKRRPKSYQLLTKPRDQMIEIPHRHKHRSSKPLAA